ncbi:SpoIIE family protein phosphatase [Streptomyces mirabilis]|uniref:SpoIIE family protein phosphatase n=1 Tax=Streptomyces mirabilis TaxID=68239 RepID=A0ABU3V5J5_9ACTN|nr:SpoIIE family protein phosphatase [Streptomyces mirabilis]MCX5355735.1 SpoIIE family protein phosphatase [Streptomyces mirabilis]MDU9001378.1 SpoIIE family protein phosphatase [Streptomyces mirabilis]
MTGDSTFETHICEDGSGGIGTGLGEALHRTVSETVRRLGAVATAVYLLDADRTRLEVAMIAGSPPSIFSLLPGADLDSPYEPARALASDIAVGDLEAHPEAKPPPPPLSYPYLALATPVVAGHHRFGALMALRLDTHGRYSAADQAALEDAGKELATALTALSERGEAVVAASTPTLIPARPAGACTAGWGLPDVPGSDSTSMMYPLRRLADLLNQATTKKEVAAAARSCVMRPLRARAVVLAVAQDGRFWVVGHSGDSSELARGLHGSRVNAPSSAGEALRAGPQFRSVEPTHPGGGSDTVSPAHSDLAEAHLPLIGNRHVLDVPLLQGSDVLGVCCLFFDGPRGFPPEERALMTMMAGLLGAAVQRVELSAQQQQVAEHLQRQLLPPVLPMFPRLTATARYRPADITSKVGGDWYDVISAPADRIVLVVGDVEGHSLNSAALMGQARTALASYAAEGHRPAVVIERTGRLLAKLGADLLVTCCVVSLDTYGGTAEVALAGHPQPLVRHPDGRLSPLHAPANLPLGVTTDHAYQGREHTLRPGSVLMLYSDGLNEYTAADPVSWAQTLFDGVGPETGEDLEQLADQLVAEVTGIAEAAVPQQLRDDAVLLLARYEAAAGKGAPRTAVLHVQRRDLQGVRTARAFVTAQLRAWDLATMTDPLQLLVSELVTNALVHAGSDVDVRLRAFADHVRLEVRDSASDPPIPSPLALAEEDNAEAEHGRGLLIVEALAGEWNTSPNGRGKTVSLEMPVPDLAVPKE